VGIEASRGAVGGRSVVCTIMTSESRHEQVPSKSSCFQLWGDFGTDRVGCIITMSGEWRDDTCANLLVCDCNGFSGPTGHRGWVNCPNPEGSPR
jgi:hypothetical protein